jgi:hypothetical protein
MAEKKKFVFKKYISPLREGLPKLDVEHIIVQREAT